ncbi:hypothetical protein V502_02929 [Pseudogymnoascus sp. VKM F-4520 (FW-2644)]|nr:hypothetical protein V502_02929 [Pseudogymnoascus sp. VKM F-4520 (FW-2644)]
MAASANRDVNISRFVKSPELELFVHNVPDQASNDSKVDMQLPIADFYLDCLPKKFSHQLHWNQSNGIRARGSHFIRLFAGQSRNQDEMSESFLDAIRKELQGLADTRAHLLSGSDGVQNDSDHPQLDMFCKTRLESYRREQDLFSVLVFALSGSTSILTIVEHDLSRGRVPDVGNPQPEKLAVVKDKTSTTIMQGLINSIIDRSYFAELNGCLRVDISISNVTATITDIKIDMEPRIFCQQESFDDWMVNQNPGGHEALLCLLLTQHQQKSKRLTAKQVTVCAAFDAISPQLAATFDCIAHVAVMRSLAFQFTWEGTVLDVGCGQGVFGGLLALYHKGVDLYGTDMSEVMIKAPQIGQYYHMPIRIGPMEQTLISSPTFDHITCFSVFQYVTPMTFMAALSQMFLKARKSITFDIPEVPSEYARKLNSVVKLSRPTDHLPSLDRIGTPAGWKLTMHRHCLTYTEPNYGIDVYSRYISVATIIETTREDKPRKVMSEILGKQVGSAGYGLLGLTWRSEPLAEEDSFKAMRAALANGSNFWNAGEFYGPPDFNSLTLLEKYFTKYPEDANEVLLSVPFPTKIAQDPAINIQQHELLEPKTADTQLVSQVTMSL